MSLTPKQGIITCIPKEGKPRHLLKNWRPISSLNTAYKIASASIANRLKLMLPKIIHSDQKGFMKGRYIGRISDCCMMFYYIRKQKKYQDSCLWLILKERSTAFLGHLFKKLWNFSTLVQTLEDGLRHFITMPVHVFRSMVIIQVPLI